MLVVVIELEIGFVVEGQVVKDVVERKVEIKVESELVETVVEVDGEFVEG